jgi:putative ABC transport system ATP-binding protein
VGAALLARDLELWYRASEAGADAMALDVDVLRVEAGESVGITGPSGAGKTSLLQVLTGLIRPQRGSVDWAGTDIVTLSEGRRDAWRRANVGFIFQEFHLVPELSPLDNVLLPVSFTRARVPAALHRRAVELLARVGLHARRGRVATSSRGEMQRLAVSRALLFAPAIVVADEPTASLDAENARLVGRLLLEMCDELRITLVVVSQDRWLLESLDRSLSLVGGRLTGTIRALEVL